VVDIQKILQIFEDLVYEIALWPVLIPRTFFHFAFRPKTINSYVRNELARPAAERYGEYLSPIVFWLLIAVIPWFLTTDALARGHYLGKDNWLLLTYIKEPREVRFVALTLILLWPPLGFAIALQLEKEAKITRESLRQPFYTQCMCLAPFVLLALPVVVIMFNSFELYGFLTAHWVAVNLLLQVEFVFFFGMLFLETILFRSELNIGWLRAFGICLWAWAFTTFVGAFMEVITFAVITGFRE
jgi:hypothetical protein